MNPTTKPLFTHLLAEKWQEQNKTPKPTALGTMLRYSGAYGCGRKMGYDWFDAEPTEPYQLANSWPMGLGTLVHEAVQQAISENYPEAQFEFPSQVNGFISGSCDAFVPNVPSLGNVLFELKTMGNYAFDQQVGYKRSFGKLTRVEPKGPKQGAIVQAGMNALGIEDALDTTIDWLVLGSLTFEVMSVKMANGLVPDFLRFGAEFHIPREVWEPLATEEIDRLTQFAETLDLGYLPDRLARDDDGTTQVLDPFNGSWQCSYCPFRKTCVNDGAGQVRILDSHLTQRVSIEAHLNPLESPEADSDEFLEFLAEKEK